jgi:hypothetical protein
MKKKPNPKISYFKSKLPHSIKQIPINSAQQKKKTIISVILNLTARGPSLHMISLIIKVLICFIRFK